MSIFLSFLCSVFILVCLSAVQGFLWFYFSVSFHGLLKSEPPHFKGLFLCLRLSAWESAFAYTFCRLLLEWKSMSGEGILNVVLEAIVR